MHRYTRTDKKNLTLLSIGSMVLLLGCASDPPRYPEDHRRFERIVEAVETLRTAYIQHDDQATESLLLPLDTLEIWAQGVRKDFQTYSDITLDLSIERIAINGDSISVFVSWQGVWKRPTEDFGLKARGNGILHWTGRQVILLSRVEGDLPFGMADRQALS